LESTRVVLLVTGCEESGTLGAKAFLDAHDTSGWIFLNFDGVAAPATLRYLPSEGVTRRWPADPRLISLAEGVASARPELGLERAETVAGLTYDATPVLARGGRALTLSAQDGTIPNYHWPSDTAENADPDTLARAIEVGRELVAAVERGEVD
jgi:Zn-dependent M28 family amino/carboxypeptidase